MAKGVNGKKLLGGDRYSKYLDEFRSDTTIGGEYLSKDPNHIAISFQSTFYELYNGTNFYNSMINIIANKIRNQGSA